MKQIICAVMLFLCMSVGYAYTAKEVGDALNDVAADLGFRGAISYNADTGNVFVLPAEGYDLSLTTFCSAVSKEYDWLFIKFIFKADPYGNHTAYECQRERSSIPEMSI